MSDLLELCAAVVEASEASEQVEAYAEESRTNNVRVRGAEIESLTFAESRGVGIRVISEGRVGYAHAADPDLEDVAELVASARESASFAEPDGSNLLPGLRGVDPIPEIHAEDQLRVEPERKIALALDVESVAVSSHPDVGAVESATYGDSVHRVAIASTSGGPLEYSRTDCWVSVEALAHRNGETQTGFSFDLARRIDDLDWESAAAEAADRAGRLLGGSKPSTERVPVVLDPVAATSFLGVLAGALSAESVLKGRSLLAGKVGEQVGSESVTIVDDGRLLEGPAVAPFDDEGVATGRTPLIEGGILRGFLHNTYTAARSGERSTGNAGRGGYRTAPGVSPTNLYVAPGELDVGDLLRRAGRAVYVQDVTGLHSGANPISGEFSVGATGLRVENGELAGPLREMTIASTLLEVLGAVTAVGSDLRFFPGGGARGAPSLLIGEMTVGGT